MNVFTNHGEAVK